MDALRDTIPEGHGEDLRKHMLERDGTDEQGRLKKRPRTDTNAVLPDEILHSATSSVPLKAEDDLSKYTAERLQQGLAHIEGAAQRKITPRTQEFLRLHKEAYKVALTGTAPEKPALAVVKKMDEVYHSTAFYLKPNDDEQHEVKMKLIKLRQMELFATYGGYLGLNLKQVREDMHTAARNTDDEEVTRAAIGISGRKNWIQISEELGGVNGADLQKDVEVTATVLGIDAGHMVSVIHQYATRCLEFHNAVGDNIKQCRWYDAAQLLSRDLKDLINVVDEPERGRYEIVIIGIRDEFFDVEDPDDPQGWFPNEQAKKLFREKSARDGKQAGNK